MARRIAVLILLAAAACSGGGDSGTTYEDAEAMAEALGCTGFEETESEPIFGTPAESEGTCEVDGGAVTLSVYEDEEAAEQAARQAETFGCAFAEGFGIERFVFAQGPNWFAAPDINLDDDLAVQLAEELDGEAESVDC